ncbi:MAG: hypothetical protein J6Y37_12660 [Paludibacteraceae bacterium]|nr:hypothetical protein [Paludibacteraceae bacterium]
MLKGNIMIKVVFIMLSFVLVPVMMGAKTNFEFDSSMSVDKRADSLFVLYQKSEDISFKVEVVDYLLDSICQTHTCFLKEMNSNHLLETPTPYQ